jgi:TolB protein
MTSRVKFIWLTGAVIFLLGCGLISPAPAPTADLFATLQAATPSGFSSPIPVETISTPVFNGFTPIPSPTGNSNPASPPTSIPSPSSADQPSGHIVFTCQVFKVQSANQICIMNADGSGYRRLTTEDNIQHFYPSLSPDGQNVLYAGFREQNVYEIYRLVLNDGSVNRLTNRLGDLTAPEYSPDGQRITFARGNPNTGKFQIMIMDRNGDNAGNIPGVSGWDPTWSPDGKQMLFASDRSGVRQLTPSGGNSQGPSFSPDGKWVVFTAYFDRYGDDHGCEIYIIRTDGTDLRRLTDNDYCDYQPRWGP